MTCHNKLQASLMVSEPWEDHLSICYTVCPHRGGYSEVYQLTHPMGKDGPVLRYQHETAAEGIHPLSVGFHRIFDSYDFTEIRVEPGRYQEIISHVKALRIPTVAEATGGFDGTVHGLLVKCLMTTIEYRWWRELPEEWKSGLEPVIAALRDIRQQ